MASISAVCPFLGRRAPSLTPGLFPACEGRFDLVRSSLTGRGVDTGICTVPHRSNPNAGCFLHVGVCQPNHGCEGATGLQAKAISTSMTRNHPRSHRRRRSAALLLVGVVTARLCSPPWSVGAAAPFPLCSTAGCRGTPRIWAPCSQPTSGGSKPGVHLRKRFVQFEVPPTP
jgi:hypothetical protein